MQRIQMTTRTINTAKKDTVMMIGSWIEVLGWLVEGGGEVIGVGLGGEGLVPARWRKNELFPGYIMNYITDYSMEPSLTICCT